MKTDKFFVEKRNIIKKIKSDLQNRNSAVQILRNPDSQLRDSQIENEVKNYKNKILIHCELTKNTADLDDPELTSLKKEVTEKNVALQRLFKHLADVKTYIEFFDVEVKDGRSLDQLKPFIVVEKK